MLKPRHIMHTDLAVSQEQNVYVMHIDAIVG